MMDMPLFYSKATLDLCKILLNCSGCGYIILKWAENEVHVNCIGTFDSLILLIYARDVYGNAFIDVES